MTTVASRREGRRAGVTCHHFHTDPLRCWTCILRFWRWAETRTNAKPKPGKLNFYAHTVRTKR